MTAAREPSIRVTERRVWEAVLVTTAGEEVVFQVEQGGGKIQFPMGQLRGLRPKDISMFAHALVTMQGRMRGILE